MLMTRIVAMMEDGVIGSNCTLVGTQCSWLALPEVESLQFTTSCYPYNRNCM